jgi:hypothetical protein
MVVFKVDAKQPRLEHDMATALDGSILALAGGLEPYRAVSGEEAGPRPRGRKGRGPSACRDAACQVAVGRQLSAKKALAIRVERNLLSQCDVFAALYDLQESGKDRRSRARGGCEPDQLKTSVYLATCDVLSQDAGPSSTVQRSECLVQAEVLWLERKLQGFCKARSRDAAASTAAQERRAAEEALALRGAYDKVAARTKGKGWVAAVCRSGLVYDCFARMFPEQPAAATPPRSSSAGQEKANPLQAKAGELYGECLKKAAELGISNAYTVEARERLRVIDPGKHP